MRSPISCRKPGDVLSLCFVRVMRFVIDILHPAHVHFFRNFISEMTGRGHQFLVTARAKDRSVELLEAYGIPFEKISDQRSGAIGLAREFCERTLRFYRKVRPFKPHYLLGIMGPTIAVAGRFLPSRTVVFYDTEIARLTNSFVYPLANYVVTPECYEGSVGSKHIRYSGYHELAYLHPSRFAPDPEVRSRLGVGPEERIFLLRFVSWEASHDFSQRGLSMEGRRRLVDLLSSRGRLYISSERPLPAELRSFRIPLPIESIHHLMGAASIYVGESATMASECACLGVPGVFVSSTRRGYTDEQQRRYGLVHYFSNEQENEAVEKTRELLEMPDLKSRADESHRVLLADHVDVTGWMVDFFEE